MIVDVIMPKLGESITEGTIIQWRKEIGETVELDEILLEIGTDKVDSEIPSPAPLPLKKRASKSRLRPNLPPSRFQKQSLLLPLRRLRRPVHGTARELFTHRSSGRSPVGRGCPSRNSLVSRGQAGPAVSPKGTSWPISRLGAPLRHLSLQ